MYTKFVQTSNVSRFLAAIGSAEERGAGEASWIAAIGEPGLGKTRTLEWWAVQRRAVYLRAKAEWTPVWLLEELSQSLGLSTDGSKREMFGRILEQVGTRQTPIVVDEAEKTRHNPRLLEAIRDISDLTEVEVVIGGTAKVLPFLTKHPQMASRVSATARFAIATIPDVRMMCDQLCEVKVADDLVKEIHTQALGYFREIKNAIREVERIGQVNKGEVVTLKMIGNRELCKNRSALDGPSTGRGR